MAKKDDGKKSGGKNKGKGGKGKETAGAKQDKDVIRKRMKVPLDIELSDAELAQLARDLVDNDEKIAAKEKQKKIVDDEIKGDIAMLEEAATKMRDTIRAGTVARDVECDLVFDWRACEVRIERVDTGEVVKRRTMEAEERQKPLVEDGLKNGMLLVFEGGLGKKSEVKDAKPAQKPERKNPNPNDAIEVETRSGWKKGRVLPSSGSMLDVELEDGTVANAPVEGSTWRWPGDAGGAGEKLATLGEIAKANADKKPDKRLKDGAPAIADELMIKTPAGPQRGTVTKIDGTTLFVDLGDGGMPAQVDLGSKDWSWPKEGEDETKEASGETNGGAGETDKPKRGRKRLKIEDPNGVDVTPPEGCDF